MEDPVTFADDDESADDLDPGPLDASSLHALKVMFDDANDPDSPTMAVDVLGVVYGDDLEVPE